MNESFEQLVAAFKELMERGDKDQWKLAETAWLASENYGGSTKFAKATGYAYSTVRKYRGAYVWMQENEVAVSDGNFSFADVITLADMTEERALAVQILAGIEDEYGNTTPIGTVKSNTQDINDVRSFIQNNPTLVKDALKDSDTRSAVASAAFKAASEDVVAEATGITKEAVEKKAPKKNTSSRALEVERLKLKAARAGHWAKGNMPELMREVEALAPYMTEDELMFVWENLGIAYDLVAEARTLVKSLITAKASV